MIVKCLTVGLLEENCYVLGCEESRQAVIIDPGDSARRILKTIADAQLTPQAILNTHAHFDHVLAVDDIAEATGIPFCLHARDLPTLDGCPAHVASWLGARIPPIRRPDRFLRAGEVLRFGTIALEVRFAPGHAPGHVVFIEHERKAAFVGDTLFRHSIGRYDLPGADGPRLLASITETLLSLSDDFAIYPGHGESTTIGHERECNPFVGRAAAQAL